METNNITFSNIVKNFSPAWYASVMGTGGLANVFYLLSMNFKFLKPIAIGLWWLNIALFLIFIIPWTLRWFFHFDSLIKDLKHPIMSNFFVTMPVGGLILGTNFFMMGKGYFSMPFIVSLGLVLWSFAVITSLIFGVYVMYNMMISEKIGFEVKNFSWLITPVASIVIPLLGNLLAKSYFKSNISLAKFINLIDISFFGIGFMLFVILTAIIIRRFIVNKMPLSMIAPTFWIILGPIGVGTVSLMGIADVSKMLGLISTVGSLKLLSLIFWGFGIWSFFLILSITIKYMNEGKIPFSLSWWAFIFPMSAYTLSSLSVYSYTKVSAVLVYTVFLAALLSYLWIITFIKSLIGTFNGKLLMPPNMKKAN